MSEKLQKHIEKVETGRKILDTCCRKVRNVETNIDICRKTLENIENIEKRRKATLEICRKQEKDVEKTMRKILEI